MVKQDDDRGIGLIIQSPWIFEHIPQKVANYMGHFADRDEVMNWALEMATARWDSSEQACGLFAVRVLRKSRYGAAEGERLRNAADSLPLRGHQSLGAELHYAAGAKGQKEKTRRRDAVEFLSISADTDIRRALLGSLERATLSRLEQSEVRRVARSDRFLEPAAQLALT